MYFLFKIIILLYLKDKVIILIKKKNFIENFKNVHNIEIGEIPK